VLYCSEDYGKNYCIRVIGLFAQAQRYQQAATWVSIA